MRLNNSLTSSQSMLDRIIGSVHDYVSQKAIELRFGSAAESAFDRTRAFTDSALGDLVPDAIGQLAAAFELVASTTPSHWSDAAAYCRTLIKAVADELQPAGDDIGGRANGPDNYINRLVYWVQQNEGSQTKRAVVTSDLEYLGKRLDAFVNAGNKGAHAVVTQTDADRFIIGTYLLISDILRLAEGRPSTKELTTETNAEPEEDSPAGESA
ncbi:hypothetical protein G419_05572 [Rhodococcus triatomae BKS 15-14]|nr:hypothetical protein G419_05572 [Rhodococcus triatomae BKS 15-14]